MLQKQADDDKLKVFKLENKELKPYKSYVRNDFGTCGYHRISDMNAYGHLCINREQKTITNTIAYQEGNLYNFFKSQSQKSSDQLSRDGALDFRHGINLGEISEK